MLTSMSTWHTLREPFDQTLSEARAISLRGGPSDLRLATLASVGRHGYGFHFGQFNSGDHQPDVVLRWSPLVFGQPRGATGALPPARCEPVATAGAFGPDVITRSWRYVAAGLELDEELLRTVDARYLWSLALRRDAYRPFAPRWREQEVPLPWRLHLLVESRRPLGVSAADGALVLTDGAGASLGVACAAAGAVWGAPLALAEHQLEDAAIDLWADQPVPGAAPAGPCTRLAIPLSLRLAPAAVAELRLAIGFDAPVAELDALAEPAAGERARAAVAAEWDACLAARPAPLPVALPFLDRQLAGRASRQAPPTYRDRAGSDRPQRPAPVRPLPELAEGDLVRAWSKCLALTRQCERLDPEWGRCLTETFTCYYSGTFGWSLPVIGWYAGGHPDPAWRALMRDVLAGYRAMQAADGCMPCYVAFRHQRPASRPAAFKHTQQPQIAWSVWQEYRRGGDRDWLAGYAEPLLRFRGFLDLPGRDPLGLGLWCQHHHYDGLDMFPTVDGLALRGEPVLYSSAYAAEQVQFQRALARILGELGDPRAAEVAAAAEAAHARMVARLWDRERQWFGDILADGRRETVVGMQGLFALAYGLAPADADPLRLRANLEALIAPFGICTVEPEDARFCERFFWRGPVWPASCLYGAAAARRHAPDLLPRMAAATTRFALAQPNIWECLEPHSGQVARYDEGHGAMPGTSSVVGSFAICAALEIACGGDDPFAL